MDDIPRCTLCGEPMPEGETMFKFHGFSGPCPAPALPRPRQPEELLAARIAALEADLERERIRLAACGVVAGANTRDSAREARQMLPEYRSASLCDVERAVDREMAERERRKAAEALLHELACLVRGEAPRVLDVDMGGDARLDLAIDAHFSRYKD